MGLEALCVVVLNRYDPTIDLHRRNLEWLARRDGFTVVITPGGERRLLTLVTGPVPG
jgi:hypothetical protein